MFRRFYNSHDISFANDPVVVHARQRFEWSGKKWRWVLSDGRPFHAEIWAQARLPPRRNGSRELGWVEGRFRQRAAKLTTLWFPDRRYRGLWRRQRRRSDARMLSVQRAQAAAVEVGH